MTKKCLIVVDIQNDFIDGALGFDGAEEIILHVMNKIVSYRESNHDIIFTQDTHNEDYLNSIEGKHLPVKHCVKGTHGHKLRKEILELKKETDKLMIKYTFPSLELGILLKDKKYDEIELCRLVSSICVLSNAAIAKSACLNAKIIVGDRATTAYDLDMHNKTLDILEHIHVDVTRNSERAYE